jgi:hypothetical protein
VDVVGAVLRARAAKGWTLIGVSSDAPVVTGATTYGYDAMLAALGRVPPWTQQ